MNAAITAMALFFSVLTPQKMWFAPSQPISVTVKGDQDVTLILTDFRARR